MTLYHYRARNQEGKTVKGEIRALNLREARQRLREQQLQPLHIMERKPLRGRYFTHAERAIRGRDRVLLTRQLATLLGASLPIEEALRALEQQSERRALRQLIGQIRQKICEGNSLANALKAFPHIFNPMYCAMVSAGEASGHLSPVLQRLAEHQEHTQQLKGKFTQAMIYPLTLTVVATAVIAILLTVVVPQVIEQFIHMQQTLPLTTRLLMTGSDAVRHYGPGAALLLTASFCFFRHRLRTPAHRLVWHRRLLQIPLSGRVILGLNMARYARTLSILSSSAVPLLEAMRISAAVLTNDHIRQQMQWATEQVREGLSLSKALEQTKLLSPMMRHLIASGERSGELDRMLNHAAEIQDQAFINHMTLALGLFEPLLVVCMASAVLFIILAILQPILQLNSLMA